MKLTELGARFLKIDEPGRLYRTVDDIAEAQGVQFLCPVCFATNNGSIGTHGVICWDAMRGVSIEETPGPGRWEMVGTSLEDLTLRAGSSSVLLHGDCKAHFFVENGTIRLC